jgi:hypothetical protein
MIYIALLATITPIIAYLVIGSQKRSRAETTSDYFIYSQEVSTEDYANTSVGYALQMAAIFLFAYWGALYGLGALWTPLFWGIGFWLLIRLLPYFMNYHARASTMHEYMGHVFGNSKLLQTLAAIATIVGLWGTMMAEVDYTIQIYIPIVKTERCRVPDLWPLVHHPERVQGRGQYRANTSSDSVHGFYSNAPLYASSRMALFRGILFQYRRAPDGGSPDAPAYRQTSLRIKQGVTRPSNIHSGGCPCGTLFYSRIFVSFATRDK